MPRYSTFQHISGYIQLSVKAVTGIFHRPWYFREILFQMDVVGVGSVPLIIVAGFSTGMALAIQGAYQLSPLGAVHQVVKLTTLTVVRELGPILAAIMIAGRVGSAIAAELASMRVTEQLTTFQMMGIDPVKKLIIPRLIACLIMLPILTILIDVSAMVGGWLIVVLSLGGDPLFQWILAVSVLTWGDLLLTLGKPLVFGFIIGTVGGYVGLNASGGTDAIGRAATTAMITASMLILFTDVLITSVAPMHALQW